jgi:hypothetical protein
MRIWIVIVALFLVGKTSAQEESLSLTLSQAIEIAQENSPEAEAARHTYRSAYWSYRFYKANYLPSVTLTSSPYFNKQISKVTQPDGTNLFIKQNQLGVDMEVKINQNIPLTGGSLFVKSNVQRLLRPIRLAKTDIGLCLRAVTFLIFQTGRQGCIHHLAQRRHVVGADPLPKP